MVRRHQIGVLFDLVDEMNGLHRLDMRELFAQISKGIPGMTTAQRRDWWFGIYAQPGKRDGTTVVDYIDLAHPRRTITDANVNVKHACIQYHFASGMPEKVV